jgi:hypothetical protein
MLDSGGYVFGPIGHAPSTAPKQPKQPLRRPGHPYPVGRLPAQPRVSGNLCDAHGLSPQHFAHPLELLAGLARLAAKTGAAIVGLGMLDSSPLGGPWSLLPELGPLRT